MLLMRRKVRTKLFHTRVHIFKNMLNLRELRYKCHNRLLPGNYGTY